MPDEIKNPNITITPSPNNPGFIRKTVETPILESALRDKLAPAQTVGNETGGFAGFFHANKWYFLAIFVSAIIIFALAYFAFKKPPVVAVKEANVSIAVEVPQTVPGGGEAVYKITVQNNDNQKLVSLQLELAYPDGVVFESSSPKPINLSGSVFNVPDLISGQNAAIFVKAKVNGNVNDEKILNIRLHYKYSNFNSEFIKQQTATVRLVASDVLVEISGPQSANNAQLIVYSIKYQNNSDHDIQNARIKLTYPDGFSFAGANPAADLGNNSWNLGILPKAGSGKIEIQGTFVSVNPGESKTALAEFLILGNDGMYFSQNNASFTTLISSLPLLVSQELNPLRKNDIIKPGDSLTFRVRYQNNASTEVKGVNIAVSLDSKAIDLASITAQGGQVNNNSILWNASSVPQLESLAPNESGELSYSIKVNNPATKDASKNLTVVSSIKIKSNEYDAYFSGNPVTLKISSPSGVSSALTFVSGQLPPQVGRSTTYKIKISLTNSSNDFGSGVMSAFIPLGPNALVSGSVTPSESTNVQFDQSTGKLLWNFGTLPANTGRFSQPKVLEFQVVFSPSSSQVGQTPTLIKTINYSAKDLFTEEDVTASTDDITTRDIQGTGSYSNGTVQR